MDLHDIGVVLGLFGVFAAIYGLLIEFVSFSLVRTLIRLIEAVARMFPVQEAATHPMLSHFLTGDTDGNPFALYNRPALLLWSFFISALHVASTLGFFAVIVIMASSSVEISRALLVVWGALLAISHAIVLGGQLMLTHPQGINSLWGTAKALLWRYALNWFQSPFVLLFVSINISAIISINAIAWAINFVTLRLTIDLSVEQVRKRYYALVSLGFVFVGGSFALVG